MRNVQAVRTHSGGETLCQWSPPTIARTTPALPGLFNRVTVTAHALLRAGACRRAAWHPTAPAFADIPALMRVSL